MVITHILYPSIGNDGLSVSTVYDPANQLILRAKTHKQCNKPCPPLARGGDRPPDGTWGGVGLEAWPRSPGGVIGHQRFSGRLALRHR